MDIAFKGNQLQLLTFQRAKLAIHKMVIPNFRL